MKEIKQYLVVYWAKPYGILRNFVLKTRKKNKNKKKTSILLEQNLDDEKNKGNR